MSLFCGVFCCLYFLKHTLFLDRCIHLEGWGREERVKDIGERERERERERESIMYHVDGCR